MGIRIVIAGSRDLKDRQLVKDVVNKALQILKQEGYTIEPQNITIVSGKCPTGADLYGEEFQAENGYKLKEFRPDWKDITTKKCIIKENKYGKYNALAGNIRNEKMAMYAGNASELGVLLAIQKNDSKGTQDMIYLSMKYNLRRFVVRVDKDENILEMFK